MKQVPQAENGFSTFTGNLAHCTERKVFLKDIIYARCFFGGVFCFFLITKKKGGGGGDPGIPDKVRSGGILRSVLVTDQLPEKLLCCDVVPFCCQVSSLGIKLTNLTHKVGEKKKYLLSSYASAASALGRSLVTLDKLSSSKWLCRNLTVNLCLVIQEPGTK